MFNKLCQKFDSWSNHECYLMVDARHLDVTSCEKNCKPKLQPQKIVFDQYLPMQTLSYQRSKSNRGFQKMFIVDNTIII